VLLAAPGDAGPVAAVAHAGRRGVQAGVVTATMAAMRDLGARVEEARAVVGPAVCGACYEVPVEVQAEVVAVAPAALATSRAGTPSLELRAAVLAELGDAGVEDVRVDRACTLEDVGFYSHRRDGVTGRFAGVAWIAS
jgi:copper oxidase (laccase) domain-containing protein